MGILKDQYLPQHTINDYLSWKGDWELIYGIPFAMKPSPTIGHQRVGRNALSLIQASLNANACECEVFYSLDWHIKPDTVVRPDVVVLCGEKLKTDFITRTPSLIVEIISPSTADKDRTLKAELYAEAGVTNYIIIDHLKKEVDVLLLVKGKHQVNKLSTLNLEACEIAPDWSSLFDE